MKFSGTQTGEKLICQPFPFWIEKRNFLFLQRYKTHMECPEERGFDGEKF